MIRLNQSEASISCLECEEGDGVEEALTLLGHGPCPPGLGQEEVIPTSESVKLIPTSIESIVFIYP